MTELANNPRNDNASDPFDDDPIRLGETKEIGALRIHHLRRPNGVDDA